MYYGLDTLMKMGSVANVTVPLKDMTPRVSNAVIRAFERGIIDSTSGQSAIYVAILADRYKIPMIAFSKKGKYWESLHMRNLPDGANELLADWWKADRVMWRMENPTEWEDYVKRAERWDHYDDYVNEPTDWSKYTHKGSIRIMGTKDVACFEPIAQLYRETEDYRTKAQTVIQLIKEGSSVDVTYRDLN